MVPQRSTFGIVIVFCQLACMQMLSLLLSHGWYLLCPCRQCVVDGIQLSRVSTPKLKALSDGNILFAICRCGRGPGALTLASSFAFGLQNECRVGASMMKLSALCIPTNRFRLVITAVPRTVPISKRAQTLAYLVTTSIKQGTRMLHACCQAFWCLWRSALSVTL